MKQYYEDPLRLHLPRQTHLVLRIDGRAFHTFTRHLPRPYCRPLADALDAAALQLLTEMIGARFAYGQSDEYSFLLTDFDTEKSRMWFDGNLQKIVSVSASIFTAVFHQAWHKKENAPLATFDCRALLIPQRSEVEKYFIWRQLDASANSLNMLASAHYSHEELLGRTEAEKHDLLHAKGVNWAKEPVDFKRGRMISKAAAGGFALDLEPPIFQEGKLPF